MCVLFRSARSLWGASAVLWAHKNIARDSGVFAVKEQKARHSLLLQNVVALTRGGFAVPGGALGEQQLAWGFFFKRTKMV